MDEPREPEARAGRRSPADPPAPPLVELRRGLLSHEAGDLAAAERSYRLALADPRLEAMARQHLVRLFDLQRRWDEALEERRRLVAAFPEDAQASMGLGMALLAAGRMSEGWPLYETRNRLPLLQPMRPKLDYPEWDGGPVRSLTVWDEQGAGDVIQYARFLRPLKDRGIEVTLICRPELSALMGALGVTVIRREAQSRIPRADAWAMLGSLPLRLGVSLESLPGAAPYLRAPVERAQAWGRRVGAGVRLGVVGQGSGAHINNANRSLSPEGATFLSSLPGAVSLSLADSPLPLKDFADTAAVIERLDLVITVDTAVGHLAGAIGKPCWILLPAVGCDWRWMRDRTDSPWYPSVRLFRQPAPGDWAGALRAVAHALPGFLAQGG